jgi:hypothetical protein
LNLAQPFVCRENIGRTAQRCQPGTTPTRALSAPLACARGRVDKKRTVHGSLSLLFPDGRHENRGKHYEAEWLQQKLHEEKRKKELQRLRNYGRPRWLQRHESAKPALAAEEEQREREQKAAHGIKTQAMAAAEEAQMARPTICSAL